jgi:KaiC/GvpD/RAD55 family RecA-like ATPase
VAIERNRLYPRVKSGISGFDEMVNGGFHMGTVNTITGPSGSGKTVFASQFIYEGAKSGEKGMIITPSESSDFLKREMSASFGWDFSELEKEKKISIIDVTDPVLRLQKSIDADPVEFLVNFRKLVERKLEEEKPNRLFIDDLMAFFTVRVAIQDPIAHRRPLCFIEDQWDNLGNNHRYRLWHEPDPGVRSRLGNSAE